jgi:sugar phosphate isomerase/epimerase
MISEKTVQQNSLDNYSRRRFIKHSGYAAAALTAGSFLTNKLFAADNRHKNKVPISGHLWVYASRYPPDWDCTLILDTVWSDFQYAGMEGVEVMEIILRHSDAEQRFTELIQKYSVPLTGTSYYGDMWNKDKHQEILDDVSLIAGKLGRLGGSTFGITVGDAGHVKTEAELDAQADLLKDVFKVCENNKLQPNLHNHTFEVNNGMHDLKGTLARIPDANLGPDLNWLVRGGVDPVWFINTYGHQMVYMHIRDQYADGKWTEYLGQGVTNFPAIAEALHKVNFKGRAAIELAFDAPPVNPVRDDWKTSRQYVKNVFGW